MFSIVIAIIVVAGVLVPFIVQLAGVRFYNNESLAGRALVAIPFIGMVIPPLLASRDLRIVAISLDSLVSDGGGFISGLLVKGVLFSIFLVSFTLLIRRVNRLIGSTAVGENFGFVEWFLVAYAVLSPALAGSFGTEKALGITWFAAPLLLLAIGSVRKLSLDECLSTVRGSLLGVLFFTLLLLAINPVSVLEPTSGGLIPFFPWRLWGATPHANSLGPIAFVGILFEVAYPVKKRLNHYLILACFFACFILAQSKTAWLAGLLSIGIFYFLRPGNDSRAGIGKILVTLFAAVVLVITIWAAMYYLPKIANFLASDQFGGGNFSGRDRIWNLALYEWERSPIFGYGPSIWSAEYRLSHMMNFAFHAHGQFFQIIGESGWIGLISLSGYLIALCLMILRSGSRVKIFGTALLVFLVIRCVAEPTFRSLYPFSGDFILHLVLYAILFADKNTNFSLATINK